MEIPREDYLELLAASLEREGCFPLALGWTELFQRFPTGLDAEDNCDQEAQQARAREHQQR